MIFTCLSPPATLRFVLPKGKRRTASSNSNEFDDYAPLLTTHAAQSPSLLWLDFKSISLSLSPRRQEAQTARRKGLEKLVAAAGAVRPVPRERVANKRKEGVAGLITWLKRNLP